jgi:hypothetical protein
MHRYKQEKKMHAPPTQALSCSSSKGLSQLDLPTSQQNYLLEQKQIQAPLVHLLCQFSSKKKKKSSPKLKMKNKVGVEKDEDDGLFTREGVCMAVTGQMQPPQNF